MSTAVAKQNTGTAPAQQPQVSLTASERFTRAVEKEFQANTGLLELTNFQRKLIQNYFIKLDMMLKAAETKRLSKSSPDALEYKWDNVNMAQLATDVVAFSSIGLDPIQSNHVHFVPYKNARTQKFDISFTPGYRGLELKAKKYGFEVPDDIIIRLVHADEKFTPIFKDRNNKVEDYLYQPAENVFDKGEIVGGFYYYIYEDTPTKNKLVYYSIREIEKRKPDTASAEFWGGEKNIWGKDAKGKSIITGTEKIEGWHEEMCWKTIARAAYNGITIDSEKIDQHLLHVIRLDEEQQIQRLGNDTQTTINTKANKKTISFEDAEVIDETPAALPPATEKITVPATSEPETEPDPATPPASETQQQASEGAEPGKQTKAPF